MAKKQPIVLEEVKSEDILNVDTVEGTQDSSNELKGEDQDLIDAKNELEAPKQADGSEIVDRKEYKIIILKDHKGLVKDEELTVSGNVAKALITKGLAELK